MTIDELLTDPELEYVIFRYRKETAVQVFYTQAITTRAEMEKQNPKQLDELLTLRRNRAVEQLAAAK
jgi:hypothetical protein